MKTWAPQGYLAQHYYALVSRVQRDLYAGRAPTPRRRAERDWPTLEASLFMKVQFIRIEAIHLRARAALAAAALAPGAAKNELIEVAERDARALERERAPWAAALARLLRAGVAAQRQQETAAMTQLDAAAVALDTLEMRGYAAAARARRGQLTGDATAQAGALAALRAAGAPDPEALTRMLAPGF
jgi:hypothetical protein